MPCCYLYRCQWRGQRRRSASRPGYCASVQAALYEKEDGKRMKDSNLAVAKRVELLLPAAAMMEGVQDGGRKG